MKIKAIDRKRFRIRNKGKKVSSIDRLRLSVSRSSKNISAQIIDDVKNITLLSSSSIEKDIKAMDKVNKTDISKIVAGSSLDSISAGMGSASSSLDSAGTGFDTIATAVGNTKGNYKKNSGSMFSVLGNVSMQVKRFFNTSKDLSSKASFGSTTTSNLTNTAVDSGKGGFDKIKHAISSVP